MESLCDDVLSLILREVDAATTLRATTMQLRRVVDAAAIMQASRVLGVLETSLTILRSDGEGSLTRKLVDAQERIDQYFTGMTSESILVLVAGHDDVGQSWVRAVRYFQVTLLCASRWAFYVPIRRSVCTGYAVLTALRSYDPHATVTKRSVRVSSFWSAR